MCNFGVQTLVFLNTRYQFHCKVWWCTASVTASRHVEFHLISSIDSYALKHQNPFLSMCDSAWACQFLHVYTSSFETILDSILWVNIQKGCFVLICPLASPTCNEMPTKESIIYWAKPTSAHTEDCPKKLDCGEKGWRMSFSLTACIEERASMKSFVDKATVATQNLYQFALQRRLLLPEETKSASQNPKLHTVIRSPLSYLRHWFEKGLPFTKKA